MRMLQAYTTLFAAAVIAMGAGSLAAPCLAQDANTGNATSFAGTKHVLGLQGLKHNASGTLAAENGSLVFTKGKKKVVVPAASIQEVMTGKDTERTVGGSVSLARHLKGERHLLRFGDWHSLAQNTAHEREEVEFAGDHHL